jgi:hypothetical protein
VLDSEASVGRNAGRPGITMHGRKVEHALAFGDRELPEQEETLGGSVATQFGLPRPALRYVMTLPARTSMRPWRKIMISNRPDFHVS